MHVQVKKMGRHSEVFVVVLLLLVVVCVSGYKTVKLNPPTPSKYNDPQEPCRNEEFNRYIPDVIKTPRPQYTEVS